MELLLLWLLSLWTGCAFTQEKKPGPGVVNVPEGDDAHLPCVHSSGQRVDGFDWRKNNGEYDKITVFEYPESDSIIDSAFTGRVQYTDKLASGDASIMIKNTGLKDNGTYTCGLGLERKNRQEIQITLNVACRSLKIRNVPGAAPKPDIDDVLPLDDRGPWKLLKCTADGVPAPELKWLNSAGKELNTSVSRSQSGRYVNLLLNVTKTDTYTCVATQEKLCHQTNNTREVTIPEFVTKSEGDDAVLSCSLDSNENSDGLKFYWTKDYKEFFSYNSGQENIDKHFKGRLEYYQDQFKFGNASVKIQRTQTSDSGSFSCIFQNIQKSYIILQIVDPKIEHPTGLPLWAVPVIVIPFIAIIAFLIYRNRSQTGRAEKAESAESKLRQCSSDTPHPQNSSIVKSTLLNLNNAEDNSET